MSTAPTPQDPPGRAHCGHGADPVTDPVGCRGFHVPGHTACLAHLAEADRDVYLDGLAPGADIDHSGTPFTPSLLQALLKAVRAPFTERPSLGDADFREATFNGHAEFGKVMFDEANFYGATFNGYAVFSGATFNDEANFNEATFNGYAEFSGATFNDDVGFVKTTFNDEANFYGATFRDAQFIRAVFAANAEFGKAAFDGVTEFNEATFTGVATFGATFSGAEFVRATFNDNAWFREATFTGPARFGGAKFNGCAWFREATFNSYAGFHGTTFNGDAEFREATFSGDAQFGQATFTRDAAFVEATFTGNALFSSARFESSPSFGPLACQGRVDVSGATFETPVTMDIAARELHCVRTQWNATATLRLRDASVDLSDAVLSARVTITTHPTSFRKLADVTGDEAALTHLNAGGRVRVTSLRGVDVAYLVLTDVNLTECRFAGAAFHLDQLRLEGHCIFARTPTGINRRGIWPFWRWTRRDNTLAEEHRWRAARAIGDPAPPHGWHSGTPYDRILRPADIAALYRQLRKAFEDSKNEPGAADFYYGEMEMRRHDATGPRTERGLLWAYWLLSGYGLRASRALLWLALTMFATVLALMLWGLPTKVPLPSATGTTTGNIIVLKTDQPPDPTITGDRVTLKRADQAVRVSINAMVFRASEQNLTHAGNYIDLAARIVEPILLALAVLAVRARVKR
ncbi:pentapeptide repeat-containing protein [Kitasatospora aureofaciens]|uniref:pentapeptide repeat-containing protein n=1 Tax=Kitasatospora aureofaciens TaxID=1894 RepID=UPI0037C809C4